MPRQNPQRGLIAEGTVARVIAKERADRGWSFEGLAKRMTDAGCPMQASAIHRIEKASPPRRITVDEAVAFARVFDLTLEALIYDPPADASRLNRLWNDVVDVETLLMRGNEDLDRKKDAILDFMAAHPRLIAELKGSRVGAERELLRHIEIYFPELVWVTLPPEALIERVPDDIMRRVQLLSEITGGSV